MKIGIKSLQDFAAFLIRRKWWVIVPFVALFSVVAILTMNLPKVFVSEALILVQPRDVPENFVMDLMSRSTEQRLKSIQQMVLSRQNVTAIIDEFKGRLPELGNLNLDEKVEKIRSQIDIQFGVEPNSGGGREVTSFRISYQHRDPQLAQEIAQRLTKRFIQEDNDTRSAHVQGTTEFLTTELQKKEALLEESERRLKALRSGNQNQLPTQLEANLRALDRLFQEKNANREALDRLQTATLNVESILLNVPEFLTQAVVRPQTVGALEPEEKDPDLERYLAAKAVHENLILAGGKPNYPDVVQAKAVMERAKAKVPPDVLAASEKPKPPKPEPVNSQIAEDKRKNPQWVSLQNQMREIETETNLRLADKSRVEDDIIRVTRRVEATPQIELMLTEVERDNAEIRKQREEIHDNLTKAQLSQNLEINNPSGNFQVVDQANYPLEAAKPNTLAVLLVGCLLSLALAIGVALVADIARQRVWTQAEIESIWGVPVMVDIPAIVTDSDQDDLRKKRLMFASLSLAFLFFYSVCLYGVYLKHNYILQRLDPVLQQVVYR
jgi:polysaccharide biosynthesis transport protein